MRIGLALLLCVGVCSGCRTVSKYVSQRGGNVPARYEVSQETQSVLQSANLQQQFVESPAEAARELADRVAQQPNPSKALALSELYFKAGTEAEQKRDPTCVDAYYHAAAYAYYSLFGNGNQAPPVGNGATDGLNPRAVTMYNTGIERLVQTAQQFGRLDPHSQLSIEVRGGRLRLPVKQVGFVWLPGDFDEMVIPPHDEETESAGPPITSGIGVPVAAVRLRKNVGDPLERHYIARHPFAATAVLRPDLEALFGKTAGGNAGSRATPALELYDPLRISEIKVQGQSVALRADASIPLSLALKKPVQKVVELTGFFTPELTNEFTGLGMLEPYQPGKIPVVFVHGLLSGPSTWNDMLCALRAHPELLDRYQLWLYLYPTGTPFLETAAAFREDLARARDDADPNHSDPYLDEMVLVGHSMGGLLSKLQVSASEDRLWNLVANKRIEDLKTDEATRQELRRVFYFEPQTEVKRVIFIGTPHHGSSWSQNSVGRFGSKLVQLPSRLVDGHRQLMRTNPDAFKPLFAQMVPNSVDLLAPGSPLLTAMDNLRINSDVKLHSIIGTNIPLPDGSFGDGVVPVSSAHIEGAESEFEVTATHVDVHRRPESIREVMRILKQHSKEVDSRLRSGQKLVFQ